MLHGLLRCVSVFAGALSAIWGECRIIQGHRAFIAPRESLPHKERLAFAKNRFDCSGSARNIGLIRADGSC